MVKKIFNMWLWAIAYITVGVTWLGMIMANPFESGDQLAFQKYKAEGTGVIEFMFSRYQNWSSRFWIEGVTYWFSTHRTLFYIVTTIVFLVLVWAIQKMVFVRMATSATFMLTGFSIIMLVPFQIFTSAGVFAVITNYLWPTMFLALGMCGVAIIVREKTLNGWLIWLSLISLAIAQFSEQNAVFSVVIFGLMLVAGVRRYFFSRRDFIYLGVGFLLSVLGLVNVVVSPGNSVRKVAEIKTWFPNFNDVSLLRKIDLGTLTTAKEFIFNSQNWIVTLIVLGLFVLGMLNRKNQYLKGMAIAVLVYLLISWNIMSGSSLNQMISYFLPVSITNGVRGSAIFMTKTTIFNPTTWLPYIEIIVVLAIMLYLLVINYSSKKIWIIVTVFLAGLASRMAISLSPTIYASGERTTYLMYVSLIVILLIIIKDVLMSLKSKQG